MNRLLKSVNFIEKYKTSIKMKRIALILLSVMAISSCKNDPVDPNPGPEPGGENKLSLKIHIPQNTLSTYSGEAASTNENYIDSLYIDLYQGPTLINQRKFKRTDAELTIISDSILQAAYEVDNITNGSILTAKVYANKKEPIRIANGSLVPFPTGTNATSFYMSGTCKIERNPAGTAYEGNAHLVRNVAKLRINISENSVVLPADLMIDYPNIKIQVTQTPDTTSAFENEPVDLPTGNIIQHALRSGTAGPNALRPYNGNLATFNGGQIDSLYLYENLRSDSYTSTTGVNGTKIKVTIPTLSNSEGNKTADYEYTLYTNKTKYAVLRNYIYTLNIKVRGQSLDPLITLDLEPWDDVNIDGSILGTYLTVDESEIIFDENGLATINFCTDAQAVYFDFNEFNANNTDQLGFTNASRINPVGIDSTNATAELAPDGFKSGHILLDKQHCGSFGFKLDKDQFPGFPNVNFSGKICLRAGNIVKCLTFPGIKMYDAHFIVGEPIFGGEAFEFANVTIESGSGNWLEFNTSPLYPTSGTALTNYSGAAVPLYLHLDENLTGNIRTGSITLRNGSGVEKKMSISQLPALRVGRFGYTAGTTNDINVYTADLYTEQLYEFSTRPRYKNQSPDDGTETPDNAIYNGRMTAMNTLATIPVFDWTNYQIFNYQSTIYQAINYCAQKNRIKNTADVNNGLKWYLPAQAQLMGMWISYESYKKTSTSNFYTIGSSNDTIYADIHWSSTDNKGYATQVQYVDFRYGNVGHYERSQPYWVRCVRDDPNNNTSSMVKNNNPGTNEYPTIDFSKGMPTGSYSSVSKDAYSVPENAPIEQSVYTNLRIAKKDLSNSGVVLIDTWDNLRDACHSFPEDGDPNKWRLPTQRELQAIWILQEEIKQTCPSFEYLSDNYYWSKTNASTTSNGSGGYTHAWTIYGGRTVPGDAGNAPHQSKSELLRVRCVKEL